MKGISWKSQLGLVAFAYAGVLGMAAVLIFERYLQYLNHPEDVAASSGMYAGGDLLLEIFIGGMLLAVTFFLVLVIAKSEPAYTIYSKILLTLSVTAPGSIGLMAIPAVSQGNSLLGYACLYRLLASPLVVLGLGMSRVFARFPRAKRITSYALLIEALTLVLMVLLLFLPSHVHRT